MASNPKPPNRSQTVPPGKSQDQNTEESQHISGDIPSTGQTGSTVLQDEMTQVEKEQDCMIYLHQVKLQVSREPGLYKDFIAILCKHRANDVDTAELMVTVTKLFARFPGLMKDFNIFLPPGYLIECGIQDDPHTLRVSMPMVEPSAFALPPLKHRYTKDKKAAEVAKAAKAASKAPAPNSKKTKRDASAAGPAEISSYKASKGSKTSASASVPQGSVDTERKKASETVTKAPAPTSKKTKRGAQAADPAEKSSSKGSKGSKSSISTDVAQGPAHNERKKVSTTAVPALAPTAKKSKKDVQPTPLDEKTSSSAGLAHGSAKTDREKLTGSAGTASGPSSKKLKRGAPTAGPTEEPSSKRHKRSALKSAPGPRTSFKNVDTVTTSADGVIETLRTTRVAGKPGGTTKHPAPTTFEMLDEDEKIVFKLREAENWPWKAIAEHLESLGRVDVNRAVLTTRFWKHKHNGVTLPTADDTVNSSEYFRQVFKLITHT
jgi:Paired amphipathic helix repeat